MIPTSRKLFERAIRGFHGRCKAAGVNAGIRGAVQWTALVLLALAAMSCGGDTGDSGNKQPAPKPAAAATATPAAAKVSPTVAPNTGTIEVKSTPPGATVILISREEDSVGAPEPKGTTPAMITGISPGKYTVDVELNGYKYYQKEIEVKEGKTVKVAAALKKQ